MTILKIARMGHPVLARRAEEVSDPTAPELKALARDMIETMIDANGAGLAAPQVHIPLRFVMFQAPAERADPGLSEDERFDHTAPLTILSNPVIEVLSDEGRKRLHDYAQGGRTHAPQLGFWTAADLARRGS